MKMMTRRSPDCFVNIIPKVSYDFCRLANDQYTLFCYLIFFVLLNFDSGGNNKINYLLAC